MCLGRPADIELSDGMTTRSFGTKLSLWGFLPTHALVSRDCSSAKRSAEATLELAKRLYRSGTDLDFLDEGFLAQAQVAGQTLQVSDLEFRAVVLLPLTTIRRPALEKIAEFFDKGGTVVAYGSLLRASAEQGRNDPRVEGLIKHIFGQFPEPGNRVVFSRSSPSGGKAFFVLENADLVGEMISRAIVPDVQSSDGDRFHTHQKVGELDVYYLFNARSERRNLTVRLRVKGGPEIWDAHTGKAYALYDFQRQHQVTRVALEMEPFQAVVVVMNPDSGLRTG